MIFSFLPHQLPLNWIHPTASHKYVHISPFVIKILPLTCAYFFPSYELPPIRVVHASCFHIPFCILGPFTICCYFNYTIEITLAKII